MNSSNINEAEIPLGPQWQPNVSRPVPAQLVSWRYRDARLLPTESLIKKSYNTGSFMVWWTQVEIWTTDAITTCWNSSGKTWQGGYQALRTLRTTHCLSAGVPWRQHLARWARSWVVVWVQCITPPSTFRFFRSTNRIAVWFASTPRARDWKYFVRRANHKSRRSLFFENNIPCFYLGWRLDKSF